MNDNKDYINTFIKRQRIISIICISFVLLSSTISAMAVSAYLYNSNEVSYNNNASGITSTNVQGAIDELYEHATDYTSMNTRVSSLESKWSSDGRWFLVGISPVAGTHGIEIRDSNNLIRSQVYYSPSDGSTNIKANDANGNGGQARLDLIGKPIYIAANTGGAGDINLNGNVKFNGTNINDYYVVESHSNTTSTTIENNTATYLFVDITKSGYTPIGIVGITGSGTGTLLMNEFFVQNNTTAAIYYRNSSGTNRTINSVTVSVLYRKS